MTGFLPIIYSKGNNSSDLLFASLHDGASLAQWVKRWPTDLLVMGSSLLEVKSSQP